MKRSRSRHSAPITAPPLLPESVASLAGGLADDFNNILTTVMGACSLIDRDDPANDELLKYVALIRASAERAANLSDRLMHAGAMETEKSHPGSQLQDNASAGASKRDKNSDNDIVSTTNKPGDAPS
jgi:nitrogen-specific signal transduction histidine kinase